MFDHGLKYILCTSENYICQSHANSISTLTELRVFYENNFTETALIPCSNFISNAFIFISEYFHIKKNGYNIWITNDTIKLKLKTYYFLSRSVVSFISITNNTEITYLTPKHLRRTTLLLKMILLSYIYLHFISKQFWLICN